MNGDLSACSNTYNWKMQASCPKGNCAPKNPIAMPHVGSDPAPTGPRVRCGYKPTVGFSKTGASIQIVNNGIIFPNWNKEGQYSFVSDPYGSGLQVLVGNLSVGVGFYYRYTNISLIHYSHVHFTVSVKGVGERGLSVLLGNPGGIYSPRVPIMNPWYLPGGQLPSDTTGTVDVYIPLSRFGVESKFNPSGILSSINFFADSYGSNYVAYLNSIEVGPYKVSGSGF
eukprot:Phypoly_transcript_17025.p1 GENE.Phypoly_transcript_17025~~Phypoly_transcript_17025.p1  ORF type:complete len:250 (+),score=12.34 Phypoly_transcript_17025:75-752(+)